MGTADEGAGDAPPASGGDPKKDSLYEDRPGSKKIIRVLTVIAYMISVSFVAIVLSAYYVFLWHPPNPRLMHRANHLIADPHPEYLIEKSSIPIDVNQTLLRPAEIPDRSNVFREEFLRTRGANISLRSENFQIRNYERVNNDSSNVRRVDRIISDDETVSKNSRISETPWNPIVRVSKVTAKSTDVRTNIENSTNVYGTFDVATKAETMTNESRASTVFTETPIIGHSEINETRTSLSSTFAPSPSSSWISKSETESEISSANDSSSTTLGDFVVGKVRNVNVSNTPRSGSTFGSVGSTGYDIMPTTLRSYELLERLKSARIGVERAESSDSDERTIVTTTEASDVNEETTSDDVVAFGRSRTPLISRGSDNGIAAGFGRQWNDRSKDLGTTERADTRRSQITRVPTEIPRTEMEVLQNVGKKSSPENQVPVEIAPDLTRYGEPVMDSPAFIVPALVQPDYETIGKERK